MTTSYQALPTCDPHAPKIENRRRAHATTSSAEAINLDRKDAERILTLAGLDYRLFSDARLEAQDKYLIETAPHQPSPVTGRKETTPSEKRVRKPHYAHLLQVGHRLFFQAACCKPLKIIAASSDGNTLSARTLYQEHQKGSGGKLVVEILDIGREIILDMQRAESSRVQRYIFTVAPACQSNRGYFVT